MKLRLKVKLSADLINKHGFLHDESKTSFDKLRVYVATFSKLMY